MQDHLGQQGAELAFEKFVKRFGTTARHSDPTERDQAIVPRIDVALNTVIDVFLRKNPAYDAYRSKLGAVYPGISTFHFDEAKWDSEQE